MPLRTPIRFMSFMLLIGLRRLAVLHSMDSFGADANRSEIHGKGIG